MKRERAPSRGTSGLLKTGKCDKITSLYGVPHEKGKGSFKGK